MAFELYIDVLERNLNSVATLLNTLLSNEMNLYVKTRKFHWNVVEENFQKLHALFEVQYKHLEQSIDKVAERVNDLGGKMIGVMQEFAKRSSIREVPGKYSSAIELVKELIKSHERIIFQLLKDIEDCKDIYKDMDTADFLTGLLQEHEVIVWTLKKYITKNQKDN
ncbi:MAG: DNA starvation/stationary phase protection protein [Bacteroidetes bacterium]|nr:DNA starvation/stationary phase protection protein [Bacteroidota bacterium]